MHRVRATVGHVIRLGMLLAAIASGLSCQPGGTSGLPKGEAERIASTYLNARNTANLALLDQVYDPAVIVHDCSSPADIRGLDSLKTYYKGSHEGFPDLKMAYDQILTSGDYLITRWTITGTNSGSMRGMPPTGKAVRFSGVAMDRIANGKIVEEWVDWNVLGLLQQFGFSLVPPSLPVNK